MGESFSATLISVQIQSLKSESGGIPRKQEELWLLPSHAIEKEKYG
jgi:hypothetical protein